MILSLGRRVMRWGDCDVSGGAVPRPAKDKVGEGDDVDEASDALQAGAPRRRNWSDEEKAWIVQESLERGTTVEEVAERHGVPSRRLSYWRKLARKGQLVVPAARPGAKSTEQPPDPGAGAPVSDSTPRGGGFWSDSGRRPTPRKLAIGLRGRRSAVHRSRCSASARSTRSSATPYPPRSRRQSGCDPDCGCGRRRGCRHPAPRAGGRTIGW